MALGQPRSQYRRLDYLSLRACLYARAADLWLFAQDHPKASWLRVASGCGISMPSWAPGDLVSGIVRLHCVEQGKPYPYRLRRAGHGQYLISRVPGEPD